MSKLARKVARHTAKASGAEAIAMNGAPQVGILPNGEKRLVIPTTVGDLPIAVTRDDCADLIDVCAHFISPTMPVRNGAEGQFVIDVLDANIMNAFDGRLALSVKLREEASLSFVLPLEAGPPLLAQLTKALGVTDDPEPSPEGKLDA